ACGPLVRHAEFPKLSPNILHEAVMRLLNLLCALVLCPVLTSADNWPRFRGPDGSGVAPEQGIPTSWKLSDFAWQIELPGEGHGAPVIWDKYLFVTSASADGIVRSLYCLNAETGKPLWSRDMGFSTHPKHKKNSYAST